MVDEKGYLKKVITLDSTWFNKSGWNKVSVSSAKAMAVSLGIKNVSAFVNQVPHMRSLLALGNISALREFVESLKASNLEITYPNTYTYMSTTVSSE